MVPQFVVVLPAHPERSEWMSRRSRFYSTEIQRWLESPKILKVRRIIREFDSMARVSAGRGIGTILGERPERCIL
jgi:hypothetical protein